MKEINIRRSIREYDTSKIVRNEAVIEILRAGMQAPSARNQRPWKFIVVKNKEMIEKFKTISKGSLAIENSELVIVLTMEKNENLSAFDFKLEDMAACIQNMMLKATSLDMGSLWIGIAPLNERMKRVSEIINQDIECFALLALGYPLKKESLKYIDRFEESRITYLE